MRGGEHSRQRKKQAQRPYGRCKLGLGGSGKGFRDDPRGRTSQAAAQGPGSLERDLEAPAVAGYMDEKVHRKRTGVGAGRSSDMVPQDPSWEILWVQWDLTACSVKHPCPRDSQESSPSPQFKIINSSAFSLLHSPTLTSIHDHRKNHSFD